MVKYSYDAYGNVFISGTLSNTIGKLNPYRYRGYYYDEETNLFLVSSRYYSPELCRWISPDDIEYLDPSSINGLNLYCYCFNNPIMYIDPYGNDAILITEYLPMGLPIVGHSVLFVQDENGEWWITEYSSSFPDKSTAHVICRKATQSDWERFKPQKGFWNSIKNLFQISGNSSVYLKGDYSNSLSKAQSLNGLDFGGYHAFTNNCLHYVKSILSETNIDLVTNNYFKNSKIFIPCMFTNMTTLCSVIDDVIDTGNKVYNFIKGIFN